jgi:FlaA1/EpsC-like NDP-sugar epimerase
MSDIRRILDKYGLNLLMDALSVVLAFYLAMALRFAGEAPPNYLLQFRRYILAIAGVYCLFNGLFGLYGRIWLYASSEEIVSIIEAVATSTLLVAAVDLLWPAMRPLPLSVVLMGGLMTLGALAVLRYRARLVAGFLRRWRSRTASRSLDSGTRVLIVGAGQAGQLLAWRLLNATEGTRYHIIGFIDDDPRKHGMRIHGIKVLGGRQLIPDIAQQQQVELIIISIHTISSKDFHGILSICQSTSAKIKTLPDVFESLRGLRDAALLRDITVEDLVGREPVSINRQECRDLLADKVVLVTGAAGTIGSELCRQIVHFEPRQLVMVDNNETGLHDLRLQLRSGVRALSSAPVSSSLSYVIADVTDRQRMEAIFREYHPQITAHAAAYKHVPLMEDCPEEAVRVNVGGTLALFELAEKYGTERFVLVSTDKAVDPVSVLGASKRLGEMLVAASPSDGRMIATAVRFGNVLGSRGSVVPIFDQQIDAGGPVTVTDPEATRFFMSVSEAASLILQAASMAQGGEVFMLEMGEQIRIVDLAARMIRLRGLRVGEDIHIVYTGLRPGERLYEKLVASSEERLPTSHPQIDAAHDAAQLDWATLRAEIDALLDLLEQGAPREELRERLFAVARAPLPAAKDGKTSEPS